MYGKLVNGTLQHAPKNFVNNKGQYISNFNKNKKLMEEYGLKKIIDVKPTYNEDTQYLKIKGYCESSDYIFVRYEILNIEHENTLEDRIAALEQQFEDRISKEKINVTKSNNKDSQIQ